MGLFSSSKKKISRFGEDIDAAFIYLNRGSIKSVRKSMLDIIESCEKDFGDKDKTGSYWSVYGKACCLYEMSALRFGLKSSRKYLQKGGKIARQKDIPEVGFWRQIALLYGMVNTGRSKEFDRAVAKSRRLMESSGGICEAEILEKEIMNLLNTGKEEEALEKAENLKPASAEEAQIYPPSRVEYLKGLAYRAVNDFDRAKKYLSLPSGDEGQVREWMAGASYNMASLLLSKGDIAGAEEYLSNAEQLLRQTEIEDSHYHCDIENIRGQMFLARGKFRQAEEEFKKATSRAQSQDNLLREGQSRFLLGKLYLEKGEPEESLLQCEEGAGKFVMIGNDYWLQKVNKIRDKARAAVDEKRKTEKDTSGAREKSREAKINKFMREMVSVVDINELQEKSIDFIMKITGADRGYLILVDNEGNLHSEVVRKRGRVAQLEASFKSYSRTFVKEVLKTGKSISVSDTQAEDRFAYAMSIMSMEIRSVVCVPMKEGNRIRGLIYFDKKQIDAFEREDIKFVESVAEYVCQAMKNARIYSQTREKLQDTRQQLTQAEKLASIGTLASGLAHEINNPMGAILTSVQGLLKDPEDEDKVESLMVIQKAVRRCRKIVKNLLSYSRVSDEGVKEEVNIDDVVEDALMLLSPQAGKFDVCIKKELKQPPQVKGSLNQLQQVLTNIGLNAIEAVKDSGGEGEIIIKTYEENDFVIAEIIDNGRGIPAANLTRLFDPFFTTKDIQEGTGLGLSVSYGIIKRHGGDIEVDSELGEGSRFRVKLPKLYPEA